MSGQPMSGQPQSKQPQLILGTAGHIDHGKSALVKALCGVDPDRLKEEKDRGITIELGFAQLLLPNNTSMGVIDVPGHERFVRQMISGSTGVDVALLCIAADDGIMPQTIEHVAVLQLLGVNSCVVALTKADLVEDNWLDLVRDEIQVYLQSTPFAASRIVAVSSKTGMGLEELKSALVDTVAYHQTRQRGSKARLPIDRVFTIKGSGTVVTGTLWSGTIAANDEVEILPSGKRARVRSVQVHGQSIEKAESGNRVALNLNGVTTDEVRPGDFLTEHNVIQPTDHFDVSLTYIDTAKTGKPLVSGSRVHLAHGTKEVLGRVLFINTTAALISGTSTFAQIRLEEPLPVARRDHFIIRSYSPVAVIGGGLVLQSHPRRSSIRSKEEYSFLEALEQDDIPVIIQRAVELEKTPFTAESIVQKTEIDLDTVVKGLEYLLKAGTIISIKETQGPTCYAAPDILKANLARIENLLISYHGTHPEQPGLSKTALKQRFNKYMDQGVFNALLTHAQSNGIVLIEAGMVSHPKAGGHLKQADEKLSKVLLETLRVAHTTPPLIQDLAKDCAADAGSVQRTLSSLCKQGIVIRVSKELYFEKAAFDQLLDRARDHLRSCGRANAADLKEAMGTSRKYAIPLLEYFDSARITKRDGDTRTLIS